MFSRSLQNDQIVLTIIPLASAKLQPIRYFLDIFIFERNLNYFQFCRIKIHLFNRKVTIVSFFYNSREMHR